MNDDIPFRWILFIVFLSTLYSLAQFTGDQMNWMSYTGQPWWVVLAK